MLLNFERHPFFIFEQMISMKNIFSFGLVLSLAFSACGQQNGVKLREAQPINKVVYPPISLDVYLQNHPILDKKVDSVFATLSDTSKVAQLLMPAAGRLGKSEERITYLVEKGLIGGMILLNGTKEQFTKWVKKYEGINQKKGSLPFLYSADAEPSLVNRKVLNSAPVKKANKVESLEEVTQVAKSISDDLNDIGINYNFAPVVDVAKNATVGYRGFGSKPENVIPFSEEFIRQTQTQNIIATAKHFPGHGLVSGDTHKSLQVINGELKELKNYPPLIEKGVLSIMIAHIAIENNKKFNTNGLPSTCSKRVVTDLLRDSLGFEGLIVTDAMGMGGVVKVLNNSVLAIGAGCDILLMPKDVEVAHREILAEYNAKADFKKQVEASVKRIIRMKICLGLID